MVTPLSSDVIKHELDERQNPSRVPVVGMSVYSSDGSVVFEDAASNDTFSYDTAGSKSDSEFYQHRLREQTFDKEAERKGLKEIENITPNPKTKVDTVEANTPVQMFTREQERERGSRSERQRNVAIQDIASKGNSAWFTLSETSITQLHYFSRQNGASKMTAKEIEAREREATLASSLLALDRSMGKKSSKTDKMPDKKLALNDDAMTKEAHTSSLKILSKIEREAYEREQALMKKLKNLSPLNDGSEASFLDHSNYAMRKGEPGTTEQSIGREISQTLTHETRNSRGSTISSITTIEAEARKMEEKLERKLRRMGNRDDEGTNTKTPTISNDTVVKENDVCWGENIAPNVAPTNLIESARDDNESPKQNPETEDVAIRHKQEEGDSYSNEDRWDDSLPSEIVVYSDNSTISSNKTKNNRRGKWVNEPFESKESEKANEDDDIETYGDESSTRNMFSLGTFPDAAPVARQQKIKSIESRKKTKTNRGREKIVIPKKSSFRDERSSAGKRVSFASTEVLDLESDVGVNGYHQDGTVEVKINNLKMYRSDMLSEEAKREERTTRRTMKVIYIILFAAFLMILVVALDPLRKILKN